METQDNNRRPKFGNRFLENPANVFQHNAWDNVEWDEIQEKQAIEKVMINSSTVLSQELQEKYEEEANEYWNKFYGIHQNRFFKDRHWLFTEFPELAPYSDITIPKKDIAVPASANSNLSSSEQTQNESKDEDVFISTSPNAGKERDAKDRIVILEVGCGVGNTVFPLLEANIHPNFFIYCCDFSDVAISIVQNNPAYDEKRCKAFVWDITDGNGDLPFPKGSLDIITLIFVLSAINPEKLPATIETLRSYLRPGGVILFRDYGRYDMAELRFKPGHCLQEHFYVRGDGTRVYFFTQEELHDMFTRAGLEKIQNIVDRRLQVNRGKLIKMYRVWIQMKYKKPEMFT